jgi:hypothetical protein
MNHIGKLLSLRQELVVRGKRLLQYCQQKTVSIHCKAMESLAIPCKRYKWMVLLLAQGLGINKQLMLHGWITFNRAVQVQSWLMGLIIAEQKRLCEAHMQVLIECFETGTLDATPANLDYFQDLQALQSEGRYEAVLIQIYQLDRKNKG